MNFPSTFLLALASIFQGAYSQVGPGGGPGNSPGNGGPGDDGLGPAPPCARYCLSSAFPATATDDWANTCATPTALSDCISTYCTSEPGNFTTPGSGPLSTALSSASLYQSALCSVYSSCSANAGSCTWSYGGQTYGPGATGPYGPSATRPYGPGITSTLGSYGPPIPPGWGLPGANGFFTYPVTNGRSTGFTTTTFTITSTTMGATGPTLFTSTVAETATLVAAGMSSGNSPGNGIVSGAGKKDVWTAGALAAAGVATVVLM